MLNQTIISQVRKKKELQFLGRDFIISHVDEMLRLDKHLRKKIQTYSQEQLLKSKECKKIVKDIRAAARKIYGIFQPPNELKRRKLLCETPYNSLQIPNILHSHLSTKERIDLYPDLFKELEEEFGKPLSILDLACGLNPVAYYYYTQNTHTTYVANEFSEIECEQLQQFFDFNSFNAQTLCFNCVKEYHKIPSQHVDWCFLLKALDTFEYQKKYVTYDILDAINATLIIASFPVQNIRGVGMKRDETIHWFEKMLDRGKYSYYTKLFDGEVYYIITKT